MSQQGYRAQEPPPEEPPAPPVERASKLSLVIGVCCIVITVGAMVALVKYIGTARDAQNPPGGADTGHEAGTGDATVMGTAEDVGDAGAPVVAMAFPGSCEGNMRAVATLKQLATDHPDVLRFEVRPMGSPAAREKGLSCASYILKADGVDDVFEGMEMTPDGFAILATKSPDMGGWTVAWLGDTVSKVMSRVSGQDIPSPAGEEEVVAPKGMMKGQEAAHGNSRPEPNDTVKPMVNPPADPDDPGTPAAAPGGAGPAAGAPAEGHGGAAPAEEPSGHQPPPAAT